MEMFEFLEFALDKQRYGIDINLVQELSNAGDVTVVPNSHPSVMGIYSRRGSTVTVIDLRNCFRMSAPRTDTDEINEANCNKKFIVTMIDDNEIAFCVDDVTGIYKIEEDKLMLPSSLNADALSKWFVNVNNNIVDIIDFDKIMKNISCCMFE